MSMGKKKWLFIAIATAMIIMGILFITVFSNGISQMIKRCTATTEGVVTEVYADTSIDSDGDSDTSYETTIEYEINGETYTRKKDLSIQVDEGTKYTVRYNPNNTKEVYIEKFDSSPGRYKLIGVFLIIVPGIILILSLPEMTKKKPEKDQENQE